MKALPRASSPARPLRVLVVDDEETWSTALVRVIQNSISKHPPTCFTTVSGTVAYLSRNSVDLIFLDLNVEDSQGLQTLQMVRAAAPLAAILIVTGEADEELALESLREGAQDYLVKGKLNPLLLRNNARYAIERMRILQELHREEKTLGMAMDTLPACIALLDESGRISLANRAWETYPNPQNPLIHNCHLGTDYLALCDQLSRPALPIHAVARGILQVLSSLADRFSMEYGIPGPGQTQVWYEISVYRFPTPKGACVVMIHRETTLQALAGRRNQAAASLLMPDAPAAATLLALVNSDGQCCSLQPTSTELQERIHPEDRAAFTKAILRLFQEGALHQHPCRIQLGRDWTPHLLSAALLTPVSGQPPQALLAAFPR